MIAPSMIRRFFKTVLQQVWHFEVDVIARDFERYSIQVLQTSGLPRSARYLSCRHVERDAK